MAHPSITAKLFKPTPPMKGIFPLDHDNVCKLQMLKYLKCLQDNEHENGLCRDQIRDYLQCRMDNNLMDKEPWENLGLKNEQESDDIATSS